MAKVTYGLEEFEMSELIREFRYQQGMPQNVLYKGLCGKKTYFQMESGDSVMDALLFEQLLSRLHMQHRLLDVMLDDDEFERLECRYEINLCIQKKQWEQAGKLVKKYEAHAPKKKLHKQYVLAKRAEILFQTGQPAEQQFKEALELTMSVKELELRLQSNGVIAEDELWMYFRYRSCERKISEEEYQILLEMMERCFLGHQIYPEVYFEVAYQYAVELLKMQKHVRCREVCKKTMAELKRGKKVFCLPQVIFLDAVTGMRLHHDAEQERELFQQCKQAYYISLSLCKPEMAQKMVDYCEEEFGWHIIEQVK